MVRDDAVAVVGAGVIAAAVAYALTREGRAVLLLDRAEPGMMGASFGNSGHIAAELVEPLPSWSRSACACRWKAHAGITWSWRVIQRSPTRQSFMPTRASCSLRWKDDYAPPALWSLPDATPRPNPRKLTQMRTRLGDLGYDCPADGPSWVGSRPVLPDYLPGIGRLEHTSIFDAVGHQHIGLTLAPVTGELISDLVAGRQPRDDVSAFDLRRF